MKLSGVVLLIAGQIAILKDGVPVAREVRKLDFRGPQISCSPTSTTVQCTVDAGVSGGGGGSGAPATTAPTITAATVQLVER